MTDSIIITVFDLIKNRELKPIKELISRKEFNLIKRLDYEELKEMIKYRLKKLGKNQDFLICKLILNEDNDITCEGLK